jgi:hypothetical protein
MPHDASGDVRLPHVNDLHPDVATFMIARAFAETYRDVFEAPVPEDRGHPGREPVDGRPVEPSRSQGMERYRVRLLREEGVT